MSAVAAGVLRVGGLLWPIEFLVFGSLALQYYRPDQFRACEMAAAVSLIAHAWAGIF